MFSESTCLRAAVGAARRNVFLFSLLLCVFIFPAGLLHAQSEAITGLVTDPSGAVIQHAKITLTNESTHAVWKTASDNNGLYNVPHVPPGTYTMAVDAPGFKHYEKTYIDVRSAQTLAFDAHLELGSASQSVMVSGGAIGYVATDSTAGTKTNTPIIETPQSISVVTREQMNDQQPQTLNETLRYTVGIVPEPYGASPAATVNNITLRSFASGDIYLDGLRNFTIVATSTDPYLLDKVEVINGPASVLYGQSAPGGIIAMESKRPSESPIREIQFGGGSFERYQAAFDFSGPIASDRRFLYRLTGVGFDENTQVDFVKSEEVAIAPAFAWNPDESTSVAVLGKYINQPAAGAYNSVPAYGSVLPNPNGKIPTSFFAGDPNYNTSRLALPSIGYQVGHIFHNHWYVRQNFLFTHSTSNVRKIYPSSLKADLRTLSRYAYPDQSRENSVLADNQLSGSFQTGRIRQTVMLGVDYHRPDIYNSNAGGINSNIPTIDLFAPVYHIPVPANATFNLNTQVQNQLGLYGQDQISFNHWRVLLGLRGDWANASSKTTAGATGVVSPSSYSERKPTERVGLVYLFDNGLAPYASYSNSFQPTTGTTFNGTPFQPTTGQQYEAGLKYQPKGFKGFVSAAVYNLTEQNVTTTDPDHSGFSVQTGEIRARGIELQAHASVTSQLGLIAAYTFAKATNTSSASTGTGTDGITVSTQDKWPIAVPAGTASLWGNYTVRSRVARGLGFSAGARYVSSSFGDAANSFKVPGFPLFDAAVHYDFGETAAWLKGIKFQINAMNLFDRTYVSACSGVTSCYYGERREVYATLKHQW